MKRSISTLMTQTMKYSHLALGHHDHLDNDETRDRNSRTAVDEKCEINEVKTTAPVRQETLIKPRSYQVEMYEESKKRNIIVTMDTGSGKTHVAVLRIKYELDNMLQRKIIWFLAPSVQLCVQQHDYIQSQISYAETVMLCGADQVDRWTEQRIWDAVLKNVEIVVSTHQILLDALCHGFVKFESLSLIVFDEAHHCVGKSPGAKIMNLFYHPRKSSALYVPHILGLTASPVVGSSIVLLSNIENTLDSISRTPTKNRIEFLQNVNVPTLIPVIYDDFISKSSEPELTKTILSLKSVFESLKIEEDPYYISLAEVDNFNCNRKLEKLIFKKDTMTYKTLGRLLRTSITIYQELGSWAADDFLFRIISHELSNERKNKIIDTIWGDDLGSMEINYLAAKLNEVQISKQALSTYQRENRISDKVSKLIQIIGQQNEDFSGIIFVRERAIVSSLASILMVHFRSQEKIRIGQIVGSSRYQGYSHETIDLLDFSSHSNDLLDFKAGKINLLIGTNILEEGIDIPTCNIVICFQKPDNLKSFIQRRGRARHKNSKMYLFCHSGNSDIDKFEQLESEMKELYMNEARIIEEMKSVNYPEEDLKIAEKIFRIEETGAVLVLDNALSHLHHFCNTLPLDKFVDNRPEITCTETSSGFHAETVLPISIHESIRTAKSSRIWKNNENAIKDAAFEAYIALYKAGLISNNLLPIITRSTQGGEVSLLVEKRPSVVEVRETMNPWIDISKMWLSNPRTIYRSTNEINGQNFYLFLPLKLPAISDTKAYWDKDTEIVISIDSANVEIQTSPEILSRLKNTTTTLIHSANPNKEYPCDESVVKFLVDEDITPETHLRLQAVPENISDLQETYVIRDHQNIGYLFEELLPRKPDIRDVRKPFTEYDDAPEDAPYLSLLYLTRRRDFMHPVTQSVKGTTHFPYLKVLPLNKCRIDKMPFKYIQFALLIPTIMRKLELFIIAKNLHENILGSLYLTDLAQLVTAICTSGAGEITNYQRLEFLGDCVLKFCSSIQVLGDNPFWHEGVLSLQKDHIVSNSRLARAAVEIGLDRYIVTKRFTGKKWQSVYVKGNLSDEEDRKRYLSTKILADVVESIIGVAMLDGGLHKAIDCLKIFLPEIEWKMPTQHRLSIYERCPDRKKPKNLQIIETMLGYEFKKPSLLMEALTHASHVDGSSSYQQLEFLGDSILDFIVVQEMYPFNLSHVRMHELRTAYVNADLLAFLSFEVHGYRERSHKSSVLQFGLQGTQAEECLLKVSLCDFLRHNSFGILQAQKQTKIQYNNFRDEILNALETGSKYPWTALSFMRAEKFYSDIIEALLGAVWVDSGTLEAITSVIERIGILKYLRRAINQNVDVEHPKITLGKLADDMKVKYVFDENIEEEGGKFNRCKVLVGDIEVASVQGQLRKAEAKISAAVEAIKNFRIQVKERKKQVDSGHSQISTKVEMDEFEDTSVLDSEKLS